MNPQDDMLNGVFRLLSLANWGKLQVQYRIRVYDTTSFSEALRYNPISLIWISPNQVDRMMQTGEELYCEYTPGCVVGGNWDKKTRPFVDSLYYQSLKQRFINDKPWEATQLYESSLNRPPDNRYRGCETEEDVIERMEYLDTVYESIQEQGYLSQRQLIQQEGKRTIIPPELLEVRINIDRNGRPIFDDGRHRFAMAKILDIDKIPVIVIGRHRQWWKQGGQLADVADSS